MVEDFGFDACIDYRAGDLPGQLKEHCPKRVDVFFDNVGGPILDAVLGRLAQGGRVALCGVISSYLTGEHPGPANYTNLLARCGTMSGFNTLNNWGRFDEAFEPPRRRGRPTGRLVHREQVHDGLEHAGRGAQRALHRRQHRQDRGEGWPTPDLPPSRFRRGRRWVLSANRQRCDLSTVWGQALWTACGSPLEPSRKEVLVGDSFTHLHVHTEYSMLDGAARVDEVVAAAAADGQPAIGITDHGNMYGILPFYKACKDNGIKPILGFEAYMAHDSRLERPEPPGPGRRLRRRRRGRQEALLPPHPAGRERRPATRT